jgi:hypothetical protein
VHTTEFDSSSLVDHLYRVAEALERRWVSAQLADDFASRMIEAVLRFLAKTRRSGHRGRLIEPTTVDLSRASSLLYQFWIRNARRDAARAAASHGRGTRIRTVPLAPEDTDRERSATLYSGLADDLLAGETGRIALEVLLRSGVPARHALPYIWRQSGRTWDDVEFLLHEHLGVPSNQAQLRQWARRQFDRFDATLRAEFRHLIGPTPVAPTVASGPLAPLQAPYRAASEPNSSATLSMRTNPRSVARQLPRDHAATMRRHPNELGRL